MYYFLMGAMKRKVISELENCFRYYFPQHKDILEYIGHKYSFKARPQKGIIVTTSTASSMRLSSDNFVGTVTSHAMLANTSNKMGRALEWIKEDTLLLQQSSGVFPSLPGIYYIDLISKESLEDLLTPTQFNQVLLSEGDHPFYFHLDVLLSQKNEILLEAVGGERTALVMNAPIHPDSFRLYLDKHPLMQGTYLELLAPSLTISTSSCPGIDLGLDVGTYPPVLLSAQEPFLIEHMVNDTLEFDLDGLSVSVLLSEGLRSASQIETELRNGLYQAGVAAQDILVSSLDGKVLLKATKSLTMAQNGLSTANTVLGFPEGLVPVRVSGEIFPPYIEIQTEIPLTVDGVTKNLVLFEGTLDFPKLKNRMEALFPGILTVNILKGGDYDVDLSTGVVTLARPLQAGDVLTAYYNYPTQTEGPFGVKPEHSNNKAIPGVVLAFGKQLEDGDKQAVVVYPQRCSTASEYGGRWEVGVDLDIITRDPMTREELSDLLMMYFFAIRKENLTDQGLELVDISFGGESEDVYDDTSQDYFYNSSLSLTFQTDWSILVPLPLTLEQVVPSSFRARAISARTGEPIEIDLIKAAEPSDLGLVSLNKPFFNGKSKGFEDLD
jgi:hypothetical protein